MGAALQVAGGYMKPPSTVLLLGAGASALAGVPLTRAFVRTLKSELRREDKRHPGGEPSAEELERVLAFMRRRVGEKGIDIESVYETISRLAKRSNDVLLDRRSDDPVGEQTANRLKVKAEQHIRTMAFVDTDQTRYLDELVTLRSAGPLRVFSTNYDTCIEVLCERHGLRWEDGFRVRWDPAVFRDAGIDVRIHKLHGSVLWYRDEQGGYLRSLLRPDSLLSGPVRWFGGVCESLLIYPARKSAQDAPYIHGLQHLFRVLTQGRRRVQLVVIGYSFRDAHIRQIVFDAARVNPLLSVVLVDPVASGIFAQQLAGLRDAPSPLADRVYCVNEGLDADGALLRDLLRFRLRHQEETHWSERNLVMSPLRDRPNLRMIADRYFTTADREGYRRAIDRARDFDGEWGVDAQLQDQLRTLALAVLTHAARSEVKVAAAALCGTVHGAIGEIGPVATATDVADSTAQLRFASPLADILDFLDDGRRKAIELDEHRAGRARPEMAALDEWLVWLRGAAFRFLNPTNTLTGEITVRTLIEIGAVADGIATAPPAGEFAETLRAGVRRLFLEDAPRRLLERVADAVPAAPAGRRRR